MTAVGLTATYIYRSDLRTFIFGKPDIRSDCSTNGLGDGKCTFHNIGTATGTTCIVVVLENKSASRVRVDGSNWDMTVGTEPIITKGSGPTISTNPVCSGIVAAGDVIERSFSGFFIETAAEK